MLALANDTHCPQARKVSIYQEDCLFLDLYVPRSALNSTEPVPVVNFLHGGGFVYGSKDEFDMAKLPLYSGKGIIDASDSPLIFVVGNYRLGALGWLGGSALRRSGSPNLGLHDQRAVFRFIRDHIHLVHGDAGNVTAWGESAGAASLMHHLTAYRGTQDPLFRRAIIQSPAFGWQFDPHVIELTWRRFAELVHCLDGSLTCVESATEEAVRLANQELFRENAPCIGVLPIGPAVDGMWVQDLAMHSLMDGRFWKGLDAILVSHTALEVSRDSSFIPPEVKTHPTERSFQNFLDGLLPGPARSSLRQTVSDFYPLANFSNDQVLRVGEVIRDCSFYVNTRVLFEAYLKTIPNSTYGMRYSYLEEYNGAVHASDLVPSFWNKDLDVIQLLIDCANTSWWIARTLAQNLETKLAPTYQSYMASFVLYGDPNKGREKAVIWTPAERREEYIGNVMKTVFSLFFRPFSMLDVDDLSRMSRTEFWLGIAEGLVLHDRTEETRPNQRALLIHD